MIVQVRKETKMDKDVVFEGGGGKAPHVDSIVNCGSFKIPT